MSPVPGVLYGRARRCFFTLPVCCPSRGVLDPVNLHFLFDTGSAYTYLENKALAVLNMPTYDLASTAVLINGVQTIVFSSDQDRVSDSKSYRSHFQGVNILGMSWLEAANATLVIEGAVGASKCSLIMR